MNRIGMFGGTFAPFHNGHLRALETFVSVGALDRCVVLPAGTPPHKIKSAVFTDEQRLEMTRLACADTPRTEVSDWEIRKQGRSYTSETLAWLADRFPGDRLVLYVGSDMFLTLHEWHLPQEIFDRAEIFALSRTGEDTDALAQQKAFLEHNFTLTCRLEPCDPVVVSSTEVRALWAAGQPVSGLVPPAVGDYLTQLRKEGNP